MSQGVITRTAKRLATRLRKFQALTAPQLDRETVARLYLRGEGLEIGALNAPLPVPPQARVRYVDRMSVTELRSHYPELAKLNLAPVDVVDDGEQLTTIADESQDFIVANHFLEHCQNPILTLRQHARVLKPGGILFLAVPDRRLNFDARRPNTPLDHLWRDYRDGPAWSRAAHYREWVEFVENVAEPARIEQRAAELMQQNYSIHFHVWDHAALLEFFISAQRALPLPLEVELSVKHRAEIISILRKT